MSDREKLIPVDGTANRKSEFDICLDEGAELIFATRKAVARGASRAETDLLLKAAMEKTTDRWNAGLKAHEDEDEDT